MPLREMLCLCTCCCQVPLSADESSSRSLYLSWWQSPGVLSGSYLWCR